MAIENDHKNYIGISQNKLPLCIFLVEACVKLNLSARRTLVLFVHSLKDFEELFGLFLVDFKLFHKRGPLIIFLNALGIRSVWVSGTHGNHKCNKCTINHTQRNEN